MLGHVPKRAISGLAVVWLWFFQGSPAVLSGETDNSGAILPLMLQKEDVPEGSAASKQKQESSLATEATKEQNLKLLREKLRSLSSGNDPELNEDLLRTLRHGHPRLLVTDDRISQVRRLIKTNDREKGYFNNLTAKAEGMLKEPPAERHLVGNDLLLAESRLLLKRITTLAGLYRITHDRRYLNRAREDMLAAAKFSDWTPDHFLDVAEMTAAMGIGYDWLYQDLWLKTERLSKMQS